MADEKPLTPLQEATVEQKKSWMATNIPFLLAFFVSAVWALITWYIIASYFKLLGMEKPSDISAVMAMWGSVTGLYSMVLSYYFGSSQGSADKQKTLDKMTTPTPTPGVETKMTKTDTIADPNKS